MTICVVKRLENGKFEYKTDSYERDGYLKRSVNKASYHITKNYDITILTGGLSHTAQYLMYGFFDAIDKIENEQKELDHCVCIGEKILFRTYMDLYKDYPMDNEDFDKTSLIIIIDDNAFILESSLVSRVNKFGAIGIGADLAYAMYLANNSLSCSEIVKMTCKLSDGCGLIPDYF